jgi:hypothetical protein
VGAQLLLRPEKKKFQLSVWQVRDHYYDRKIKKFQLSVWRVGYCYYDQKKKVLVVCLVGVLSLLRPEKKDTVVCLVGARSLLQPEKK